ncbi:MAG: M20/M25/M40 family metallo-hydrolase [Bacteroidales bacterium]|nr:M20/M25/M40 family metallo-hydrolase [Bacteroidales bacterium]
MNAKKTWALAACLMLGTASMLFAQTNRKALDEDQQPSLTHLMNVVHDLSSSTYSGRLAGTEGFNDAAVYVIEELEKYGVQPYHGDWYQLFELECNQIETATLRTYVNANDTRVPYILGRDFVCAGMTGRGYSDAPVVFCGYGIDDASYNEYAHVDAQGKIAIILSGVPNFLPSNVTQHYRTMRQKARAAQRHGCCAMVVVNMANSCSATEVQGNVWSGDLPHMASFPMLQTTRACGEQLFGGERMSLQEAIDSIGNSHKPQSFHFRKHFELEVNTTYHPSELTGNVVGIYPGTDLRNEYIVVGAKLDHVGMQGKTCLFPGADDNASGVAVLMETARMLQNADVQPRRSVVFVLFSGGEQQRLGSQIFVSGFRPLKRVEAFVNAECLGTGDSVAVLGNTYFPSLWEVARNMDSAFCAGTMAVGTKTQAAGDAAAFSMVGIPSLVFTNYNGNRRAHVPSDIAENIDRQYLLKATKLFYETVYELTFGDYQGRSSRSKNVRFE